MPSCAILNTGPGAWAFQAYAERLAQVLGVEVRSTPAEYVYLLGWDQPEPPACRGMFIPYEAIRLSADKRRQAEVFRRHGLATPRTFVLDTSEQVRRVLQQETSSEWVLKYPTGCGGSGHRLLGPEASVPGDWPRPYLVQEFVRRAVPEVYRLYCVAGETFGWNVRRFPPGAKASAWVAHARGARYGTAGEMPRDATHEARKALVATGLIASFGCVDLLRAPDGRWLVLEVGTDGIFNYVDREVDLRGFREELERRLGEAFWAWVEGQERGGDR